MNLVIFSDLKKDFARYCHVTTGHPMWLFGICLLSVFRKGNTFADVFRLWPWVFCNLVFGDVWQVWQVELFRIRRNHSGVVTSPASCTCSTTHGGQGEAVQIATVLEQEWEQLVDWKKSQECIEHHSTLNRLSFDLCNSCKSWCYRPKLEKVGESDVFTSCTGLHFFHFFRQGCKARISSSLLL